MGLSEGLAVSATVVGRVTDSGVERVPLALTRNVAIRATLGTLGRLIERSEPIELLLDRVLNALSLKD